MVGASKILTVSYGTFSCTLEGFEEPFSTMKAIAEYFRDLAADDRYFGAEPPTPDAEMLHRIAEREIQRRVEAKISEHGVVLRADAAPAAEPAARPAVEAPALATAAAAPAKAAPAPMPPVEAAPEETGIEAEPEAAEEVFAGYLREEAEVPAFEPEQADTDSVAAKLSRIRAVVAAAQAAPAAALEDEESAADFAPSATVPAGDFGFELDLDDMPARHAAETVQDDALVAGDADEVFEEIEEIASAAGSEGAAEDEAGIEAEAVEAAEHDAEDLEAVAKVMAGAETPEAAAVEAEVVAMEDAFEEEVEDDTVLSSIGEVFEETAEEAGETAAEEAAEAEEAEAEDVVTEDVMTAEDVVAEDVVAEEAAEEEEVAASALDLGAWRLDAEDDLVSEADEAVAEEIDVAAELEDDLEAEAELEPELEIEAEAEGEAELEAEAELEPDTEAEAEAETDKAEAEAEIAPEPARTKPGFFGQAAARVIKIRRTLTPAEDEAPAKDLAEDLATEESGAADTLGQDDTEDRSAAIFAALSEEAAIDEEFDEAENEDVTAEDTDAALLAGIGAAIGQTGLDKDAEDDLLRELAEVARDARRDSHEGRAILESNASDGEASVERLMEEAKSKLEGDESRRRFSAISHLKAAVVATVADRKLKLRDAPVSGEAEAGEEIERYRDDLSKAVRPRRPAADSAPTTRRPTIETRQAPLVLISEQRIDAPSGPRADAAVVRPRRISAGNLVLNDDIDQDDEIEAALSPEEAKSFAEFAERLGAVNLSDMLEAAAAYTATVEGLPHFSRPQILRKVANVAEDEEYSREDGLRSFGMLLRQGKIQKISRGQFTITEASKFMSEARRAAR